MYRNDETGEFEQLKHYHNSWKRAKSYELWYYKKFNRKTQKRPPSYVASTISTNSNDSGITSTPSDDPFAHNWELTWDDGRRHVDWCAYSCPWAIGRSGHPRHCNIAWVNASSSFFQVLNLPYCISHMWNYFLVEWAHESDKYKLDERPYGWLLRLLYFRNPLYIVRFFNWLNEQGIKVDCREVVRHQVLRIWHLRPRRGDNVCLCYCCGPKYCTWPPEWHKEPIYMEEYE